MPLRKLFFWTHLIAGVVAGLVILAMSVTGVLLAFERQIIAWADRDLRATAVEAQQAPLPLSKIVAAAAAEAPGARATNVTVRADKLAPVTVAFGREKTLFVHRYSGKVLGEGNQGWRKFFHVNEDVHRWLAMTGDGRAIGKKLTGYSNAAFLFIVISGLYLWIPKKKSRSAFRAVSLFRGGLSGKARDFNWHNVLGLWSFLPLVLIVYSGVTISFPPARAGGPGGPGGPGGAPGAAGAGGPRAEGGPRGEGGPRAEGARSERGPRAEGTEGAQRTAREGSTARAEGAPRGEGAARRERADGGERGPREDGAARTEGTPRGEGAAQRERADGAVRGERGPRAEGAARAEGAPRGEGASRAQGAGEGAERGPRGEGRGGSRGGPLDLAKLDRLFGSAQAEAVRVAPQWQTLGVRLPLATDEPVAFSLDTGNGARPDKRSQLLIDPASAKLVEHKTYATQRREQKVRSWLRFIHTGEAGGITGQIIAFLASAAAVVLVWTGIALALRRLQRWMRGLSASQPNNKNSQVAEEV